LLLILDLDDTIIDTTGGLRRRKMEDAFHAMVEGGLSAEASIDRLIDIDRTSTGTEESLRLFVLESGGDPSLVAAGKEAYYGDLPEGVPVMQMEGAERVLTTLSDSIPLALVSLGRDAIQREKLKRSGLSVDLFRRLLILESGTKRQAYETVMSDLRASPDETWVCGDKVEADLVPARELGCHTVHMRWGHAGTGVPSPHWVDAVVSDLYQLEQLIDRHLRLR
jgi:putative hydrolase of the HAD superfamily